MVIPNYSKPDDWEKMNALGVSQYGQMTAGSYICIGPQGIVHGTTITVLNGFRKIKRSPKGGLFVTSGLGECLVHNQKQEILQAASRFVLR
jgi:urocanate hydratase